MRCGYVGWKISIILLALLSGAACTRKQENQTSTIVIMAPSGKVGALEALPAGRKACYAVNVTGPGITQSPGTACSPSTGVTAGFAEPGQPIEASVPYGADREVALLLYLKAAGDDTACPPVGAEIPQAILPNVYLVGEATGLTLDDPTKEVYITATFPGVAQNLAVQLGYPGSCLPSTNAVLAISGAGTYDFGILTIGGSAATQSFTITNSGAATATAISAVSLSAPYSFSGGAYPGTAGDCGATLASGATCTIEVEFLPSSNTPANSSLTLNYHDGAANQSVARALTGNGQYPASISISDGPTYDFGTHPVNSSIDKSFTITNTGDLTANSISPDPLISPITFKGGSYPGMGGDCLTSIAPGASCTIVVTYAPPLSGADSETLSLNYNNGLANVISSRPLAGTGTAHGPASQIVFTSQPSTTAAGAIINTTVEIRDAYNNVVTTGPDASATISLNIQSGSGTLFGSPSKAAASGVASFSAGESLAIDAAGAKTFRATKADTSGGGGTVALTADSASFTVTHAGPDHLQWTTQPGNSSAGSNLLAQIEVQDIYGNLVSTGAASTANITISISSGPGSLGGTATVAAAGGVATWSAAQGLNLDLAGSYTLQATDGTRTANSAGFTITHGPADSLTWTAQPASTTAGGLLMPTVEVQDAFGNTVTTGADATANITLSINGGPGGATLGGTQTVAAVSGSAGWSAGHGLNLDLTGSYTLHASDGTRTAVSGLFNITHGPASQLAFTTQPANNTPAGTNLLPVVEVQDAYGNIVTTGAPSTAPITLTLFSGPGSMYGTGTVNASSGTATWTGTESLNFQVSGSYTLQASDGTRTVNSNTFSITHGAASSIVFSAQPPTAVQQNTPVHFTLAIHDGYGNIVNSGPDSSATISLALSGGGTLGGTLSKAASAGVATFQAPENVLINGTGLMQIQGNKADTSGGGGTTALSVYSNSVNVTVDFWKAISTGGSAPLARMGHAMVWTGTRLLVWGGYDGGSNYYGDGALYDPETDSWTPMASLNAPSGRADFSAVWTGTKLFVWGGYDGSAYLNNGALYDPATDTWTAVSPTGAPSVRHHASAVWTGTYVVVFGGFDGTTYLANGGRYDPNLDTWSTVMTSGAPTGRIRHSAVWTGSKMLVWGGISSGTALNTGALYDPSLNSWATVSGTGAPPARHSHTAVHDGTSILIWGGFNGTSRLNSGFKYNLAGNTWTAMTTTGAPSPRSNHTAVWDGTKMVVWGGHDGTNPLDDGAYYDSTLDSWTLTSSGGFATPPPPRKDHTALWNGQHMLMWGGFGASSAIDSGGVYSPAP